MIHLPRWGCSLQATLDRGTNLADDEKPARARGRSITGFDETIRGHVACSFLALVLKKELEDRLAAADRGARASWPAVTADLNSLTETEVEQDGKRFLLRSAPRPGASLALAALGVALPPTLRQVVDA